MSEKEKKRRIDYAEFDAQISFIKNVRSFIDMLESERRSVEEISAKIMEKLNQQNFIEDPELKTYIMQLSSYLNAIISQILEFEKAGLSFAEAPEPEEAKVEGKVKGLGKSLRKALYSLMVPRRASSIIDEGRSIIRQLQVINVDLLANKYYAKFQDTSEDMRRHVLVHEVMRVSIMNVLLQVKAYVEAVIRRERVRAINLLKAVASQTQIISLTPVMKKRKK